MNKKQHELLKYPMDIVEAIKKGRGNLFISLYTEKQIYSDECMELPIDDDIVKILEELEKLLNQPTFDRYPMFECKPGITIMGNMTESEYKP